MLRGSLRAECRQRLHTAQLSLARLSELELGQSYGSNSWRSATHRDNNNNSTHESAGGHRTSSTRSRRNSNATWAELLHNNNDIALHNSSSSSGVICWVGRSGGCVTGEQLLPRAAVQLLHARGLRSSRDKREAELKVLLTVYWLP